MEADLIKRIFRSPPELATARLRLRKLGKADADDMFEYASRDDVTEYLTWRSHDTSRYTKRYLSYITGRYKAGEFYDWAIVLAASGKMIGTCGFTDIDAENDLAEIGYVVNPDFWGQGIACEAASAVIDFGFERLGLHRIEAKYMLGNVRSSRVMEKLGMTYEGERREALYINERYVSYGVYSILRDEYYGNKDGANKIENGR